MAVLNMNVKKFPAASLVEVAVSMVLILLVFSMAILIYINVTRSGTTAPKLQLGLFLKSYAVRTKENKLFTNEEIFWGEYIVKREVIPFNGNPELLICSYTAFTQDEKIIAVRKELVYEP